MPAFLKNGTLVCLELDRELLDELGKYVLLNKECNKSAIIRGLIKAFLEIYDEDGFTKDDGNGKKKTTFYMEQDIWQRFGEVCEEIGVSRTRMLQVLIKKLLSEEAKN